ncbi:MAG: HigA family addiction module antidote protein [Bifidobacteriaceae bacterium]|jgi:addiction module HigA family antidote|nr:HigA family addiction module antidote protein [Bifidobacteriaceae bacterium]
MAMKDPVHPGEIIRLDVLDELGLSLARAASALGVSRVALSRVVNGRAALSPNLAARLERAGAGSARMWLSLQDAYDLSHIAADSLDVKPLASV